MFITVLFRTLPHLAPEVRCTSVQCSPDLPLDVQVLEEDSGLSSSLVRMGDGGGSAPCSLRLDQGYSYPH